MTQPDAPKAVRTGEELDLKQLNDYLKNTLPQFGKIETIQQFPGGYSNLTYFLGNNLGQSLVLRRPPFGAKHIKGGHDMGREFRVLQTLSKTGFSKIPKPLAFCEDEAVLDCPFYIMERVQGVILRANNAPKMNLDSSTMQRLSEALVQNLVTLHAIDIHETGLIDLGKPEGYIKRQVEGWYKRYKNAQTDDLPIVDEVYQWLCDTMPIDGKPTLIHNDYKYDNVVFDTDLEQVMAILDWEMTTIGDPLMDVGTALSYWAEADDSDFEKTFNLTWLKGNISRQQFAEMYAQKSHRDLSNILYFYVFGLFKNAVVIQQIYSRWKQGFTQDERFANLIFGVKTLIKKAAKSIELNRF